MIYRTSACFHHKSAGTFSHMPELPDIELYVDRLRSLVVGQTLLNIRVVSPSLVQSVDPPLSAAYDRKFVSAQRLGKRIILGFEDDLFCVLHLMIAGRLRWKTPQFTVPRKRGLAAFYFEHGTLLLTEASAKKRATLHMVDGMDALVPFNRGGLEVLGSTYDAFTEALTRENRTLKRALTDPRLISGIGNAYSDEIMHRARLSPMQRTKNLSPAAIERLHQVAQDVLQEWMARLRAAVGDSFPDRVTAFQTEMAVHGKYGDPCPVCDTPVQRVKYAQNECNYCPSCQTEGRLLSDRSLSRLLRDDWPKTYEALEAHMDARRTS